MKVLHLLKTSEGGQWALRLMKELKNYGVEVHVALPYGGSLMTQYAEAGIITHEYNCSLKGIIKSIKDLRKIVDEVRPDIIHSHFVITTIIMRLALRRDPIPRIFEVPGPLHLEHFHTRWIDPFLAQSNDYWIATCSWTRNRYLKSGIKEDRIYLTYYGSEISHLKYQKGLLRKEFNIPNDAFVVGMVAYMYAPKRYLGQKRGLKGHEDFIDAISILQKKYSDIIGICVGGAWGGAEDYERKVKEYAKSKNVKIIFTGTRKNVGDLYQDLNCVVHPSHSENLGGAGESLMLGIPTIATNIGGFPDIVIDGTTGLLVNPKRPEEIASAIERYYVNPDIAQSYAKNGQAYVMDLLDVKNTSKKVFDFYEDILKKKKG